MNFQELSTIYQILNEIPAGSTREQALKMMLHNETVQPTHAMKPFRPDKQSLLKFTKREMSIMPKELQERFAGAQRGRWIRQKPSGVYEIRMSINGVHYYASAKDLTAAKKKFLDAIRRETEGETMYMPTNKQTQCEMTFGEFADRWLNVAKKPRIKEGSLENIRLQLKKHILPQFGTNSITEIRPLDVEEFLNKYIENGSMRTALGLYVTMKDIFNCAVNEGTITKNPLEKIPKPQYEAQSGTALSKAEEFTLINSLLKNNDPCRYAIIFILYTGLRRSELKSATSDGQWITVVCAKTRKGKTQTRRIPITPMLRPYMEHFTPENLCFTDDRLSRVVPKYLGGHTTHHLRHTFITRAQECGISKELVKIWAGHAANKQDMTESVYTHFSDEFQLSEAQKISYQYEGN